MKKQRLDEYIVFSNDRFTKRVIYKEDNSTAFVLNFEPSQSLPAHKHPGASVYLLVLQGNGQFTIDGEPVHVIKGDVLLSRGDEEMAFVNNGTENVSLYVLLNKIPDERYAVDI